MAYAVRRRFTHVTIVPDQERGYAGVCVFSPTGSWFQPETAGNWDMRTRLWVERDAMISYAGDAATKLITGRSDGQLAGYDRRNAANIAAYMTGSGEELEAYLRWLWIRTNGLLQRPGYEQAIRSVADALLERQTLSYRTSHRLVGAAILQY